MVKADRRVSPRWWVGFLYFVPHNLFLLMKDSNFSIISGYVIGGVVIVTLAILVLMVCAWLIISFYHLLF